MAQKHPACQCANTRQGFAPANVICHENKTCAGARKLANATCTYIYGQPISGGSFRQGGVTNRDMSIGVVRTRRGEEGQFGLVLLFQADLLLVSLFQGENSVSGCRVTHETANVGGKVSLLVEGISQPAPFRLVLI